MAVTPGLVGTGATSFGAVVVIGAPAVAWCTEAAYFIKSFNEILIIL